MRQLILHIDRPFAIVADTNPSAYTGPASTDIQEELRLEPPQSVFSFSSSRPSSMRPLLASKSPTPTTGSVSRPCKMEGTPKSPPVKQPSMPKLESHQSRCPVKIDPRGSPPPLIVDTLPSAGGISKCLYDKDGRLKIQTLHPLGIPVSNPVAEHKIIPSTPQPHHEAYNLSPEPSTQLTDPPRLGSKIAIAAAKLPGSGLNCDPVSEATKINGNGSKVRPSLIIPPLEPATKNRKSRFFPATQSAFPQVDKPKPTCAAEISTDIQGALPNRESDTSAARTEEIKKILTEIRQQKMQEAKESCSPSSPYLNDVTLARQIDEVEKARSKLTAPDVGIPVAAGAGKQAVDIEKVQGSRSYGPGQPLKWVPRHDSESSEEERNDWEWI